MFCITLEPSHYKFIKDLGYIPVGLGEKNFKNNNDWFTDKSGINISKKNKNYGEYTFHYWLWRNYINKASFNDNWIGFCQYRKFWSHDKNFSSPVSMDQLKTLVLKEIPALYKETDVILGEEIVTTNFKKMKFIKKGFKLILEKPSYLFNKKNRNIKFHFDLMHGHNNLDKAIDLLESEDRKDFKEFVNTQTSFNPHNMFVCRSKSILERYYSTIFPWLERCEKLFGFENLKGFGKIRIYGFLAERFLSYWFKKNYKCKTMPIIFYDIKKDFNHNPL